MTFIAYHQNRFEDEYKLYPNWYDYVCWFSMTREKLKKNVCRFTTTNNKNITMVPVNRWTYRNFTRITKYSFHVDEGFLERESIDWRVFLHCWYITIYSMKHSMEWTEFLFIWQFTVWNSHQFSVKIYILFRLVIVFLWVREFHCELVNSI